MMPFEPLRDIMHRTMENLRFIEARATSRGPFEVTQLLNSFLGALAHPWEKYRKEFAAVTIADAEAAGWPRITKEMPTDADPANLGDLIRLIRNSIAHGNFAFEPKYAREIKGLRIWNEHRGTRTWGAVVTVEDMRRFLEAFVAYSDKLMDPKEENFSGLIVVFEPRSPSAASVNR